MTHYVWTHHAITRLSQRRLSRQDVEKTIANPTKVIKTRDGIEYQRQFGTQTVYAIGKTNSNNELIIISCWINPPHPGTQDAKKHARYRGLRRASLPKKLWLTFLNQVGL